MLGKQKEAGLEHKRVGGELREAFKSLKLNETHGRDGKVLQERGESVGARRKAGGVPPGLPFGRLPPLETNSEAAGLVLMPK